MSWKQRAYRVILDVTPPAILSPVLRAASTLQYATYPTAAKITLKKNVELRNVARGRTAFILATGPSVRELGLSRIVGQDCYSVSNFFLHPLIGDLRPKKHFFAPYHPPLIFEEYVSWLKSADKGLPEETEIVLGIETKEAVVEHDIFPNRPVRYVGLEKAGMTKDFDPRYPITRPQSSPLMVLPLLIYMGYARIVLVGCDHNILKDYGGTVSNFYEAGADPRSNATSGENWSAGIIQHLRNALNVFVQYRMYYDYCRANGIELIHTSSEGWLDFIPYLPLDDIPLTNPEC